MDRSLQKKANFFCQYIQELKWMNHSKLTIRRNGLSLSIPWEKYGQIVLNNILIGVMVRPCPYLGEWTWTDHYKMKVIFSLGMDMDRFFLIFK